MTKRDHKKYQSYVFIKNPTTDANDITLTTLMSPQKKKNKERNQAILPHIVDVVRFRTTQQIPFRGHRDDKIQFGEEPTCEESIKKVIESTSFVPHGMKLVSNKMASQIIC